MPPERHLPWLRCLANLRCLQCAPADRATIMAYVQAELGDATYPNPASDQGRRAFEEDIRRLRSWGVEIPDARKENLYTLISYGEFSSVGLGEADLDALAFLLETFGPSAPNSEPVQQLLRTMADWLPRQQRESLGARRQRMHLDLRRRDDAPIDAKVETAVDRALHEGRLLRFAYRSPSRADDVTPTHTVEPWYKVFDTLRGHLYLEAYWLESTSPIGRFKQQKWQKFRLDAMVAEEIHVLPDKRNPTPPKRPRYGRVTRHFENMQVHEHNADGWVRVTATTPDLFSAVRLLLTYGANCSVIGGPEARHEMEKLVRGLAELYAQ